MNWKTYDMPYKERLDFVSDLFLWDKIIALVIGLSVVTFICVMGIFISLKKRHRQAFVFSFIAGSFSFVLLLCPIIDYYSNINGVKNNDTNMHYISYKGTGTINNVPSFDEQVESQKIRFESDKNNYYLTINNDMPISKGDKIKVNSNGKIPTSNEYKARELTSNTPKKHKINVSIEHDGKWKDLELIDKK
ncbi:hypothetical protein ACR56S_03650 [Staphylococcus hominis]|uniref:hypothetical protein n=1 Tax=Staphylococcus hominis TaxID=1290 RepID=UPI003DA1489E